jgi:hypothetical protein
MRSSRRDHLPRRLTPPPGPLRHTASGRPHRREVLGAVDDRRRRQGLHRALRHAVSRERRRRRPPELLVQGRRARLRARPRRAHDRLSELRRQRHVPLDGKRAGEPECRPALHQLRGAQAHALERRRVDRRGRSPAGRLPRSAVRRPRSRRAGLPQLPALHPPLRAREALAVRPESRMRHPGAAVEAARLVARRPSRGRSEGARLPRRLVAMPPRIPSPSSRARSATAPSPRSSSATTRSRIRSTRSSTRPLAPGSTSSRAAPSTRMR